MCRFVLHISIYSVNIFSVGLSVMLRKALLLMDVFILFNIYVNNQTLLNKSQVFINKKKYINYLKWFLAQYSWLTHIQFPSFFYHSEHTWSIDCFAIDKTDTFCPFYILSKKFNLKYKNIYYRFISCMYLCSAPIIWS